MFVARQNNYNGLMFDEKGDIMKKNIARKCLCIALASAMVFGETGTVLAAQGETASAGQDTAVSAQTEDSSAELAEAPHIWYADAYDSGDNIHISGNGTGKRICAWVNGVLVKEIKNSSDTDSWSMNVDITKRFASKYTVKIVAYSSDGTSVSSNIAPIVVKSIAVSSDLKAVAGAAVGSKGYAKSTGISLEGRFTEYFSGKCIYQVYRSVKANGTYSLIATNKATFNDGISYVDTKAKPGVTYYYKIKLATGKDKYITKNTVYAVSGIVSVRGAYPEVSDFYANSYSDSKTGKTGVTVVMSSDLANQYDVYRSTNKNGGYKKIKTVYSNYYNDLGLRRGTVYYYKVLPKYYDVSTRKIYNGKMTEPVAVKYIMDNWASPYLTQVGDRALKVEWGSSFNKTADISYEVWGKRTDISGLGYRKLVTTKGSSCILRNLASDGTYSIRVRKVKKAGAAIKYEWSDVSERTMGYTDKVVELRYDTLSSAINSAKNALTVSYKISWYRDWGASGYIIKAYNNYTGKIDKIATIKSGKTTSYIFKNVSTKTAGLKYDCVYVYPYKGSVIGDANGDTWNAKQLTSVKNVKAVRFGETSAKITWKPVPGAKKYIVYRYTELGFGQQIAETTHTYFIDKNLTNNYTYTYSVGVVSAYDGFGDPTIRYSSSYTHKIATPKITGMANSAAGAVTIRCAKVANAKTYVVYRSTTKNGTYKKVGKLASNLTFVDKKLSKGKSYYYKVVAFSVNDGGKAVRSAASAVKGIVIKK